MNKDYIQYLEAEVNLLTTFAYNNIEDCSVEDYTSCVRSFLNNHEECNKLFNKELLNNKNVTKGELWSELITCLNLAHPELYSVTRKGIDSSIDFRIKMITDLTEERVINKTGCLGKFTNVEALIKALAKFTNTQWKRKLFNLKVEDFYDCKRIN